MDNMNALLLFIFLQFMGLSLGCPEKCKCTTVKGDLYVTCTKAKYDHLPKGLPRNTVYLDMNHNNIERLTRDMFVNLTNLQTLSFMFNRLDQVQPDALEDLHELHTLNIAYNPFPDQKVLVDFLHGIGRYNNVTVLDMKRTNFDNHYLNDVLLALSKMPLKTLDISKNPQAMPFPKFAFSSMMALEKLTFHAMVDYHRPVDVDIMTFANMSALRNLSLDGNLLHRFPSFLNNGSSILPKLYSLKLGHNQITALPDFDVGLSNLRVLQLTENRIGSLDVNISRSLPQLKSLLLPMNQVKFPEYVTHILKSNSLEELNLSENQIKIDGRNSEVFWSLPNLRILNLDNSNLGQLGRSQEMSERLFKNCLRLEELHMQSAKITYIRQGTFTNLTKLKAIYLGANLLKDIDASVFQPLMELDTIYLDNNRIVSINRTTFPKGMLDRLHKLDLANNPFRCDCNLLWFLNWFNETKVEIVGKSSPFNYRCNEPEKLKNVFFSQTNITNHSCKKLSLAAKLTIFISAPVAFVMMVVLVIYRYRWHIGYLYFLIRARRRQYLDLSEEKEFEFDAFVVYNSAEVLWVKDTLLPKLEEESGLKLCVHDRDWLAGADIIDNIVESIDNSRKTLLVVSNAFAISQWCQLEMTMAQHKLLEDNRNALILVILEEVTVENMTPRLAHQLRTKTYIPWTDNEMGQKLFWKKLQRALKRPTKRYIDTVV